MDDEALNGFGVLVTRPRPQAAELIQAIQNCGGRAISFPVIEITPRDDEEIAADVRSQEAPDLVIFVSRNAVAYGLAYTSSAKLAAVGPSTADAIRSAGRTIDIEPRSGFDSESLLDEPELQTVSGLQIRIIRGGAGREGSGRELLANTLRERGATVSYLSVYERLPASVSAESLQEIESAWRDGSIDAVTIMSVDSLNNLVELLPEWCAAQLENVPLVTPATRVIKEALKRYPASTTVQAAGPQTADMLAALISVRQSVEPGSE